MGGSTSARNGLSRHTASVEDTESTVRRFFEEVCSAFPDIQFELEEVITIGDRVAHRWTFTGTIGER